VIGLALACVVLVLAVVAALAVPMFRRSSILPERAQYDRAVYRDQLEEVDRDVARGVLTAEEAASARLEIQRRLLATQTGKTWKIGGANRGPWMAVVASLFVVGAAGGLYAWLGAPALPDTPAGSVPAAAPADPAQPGKAASPHTDFRADAEKLQKKLAADPSNAEEWDLYARTVSQLGDWPRALDAYHHAIDLGLNGPEVYAGFGEMQVLAAGGIVLPAARDAFNTALKADPKSQAARYYLALADAQAGEARKAVDAWIALAASVPEDSGMRDEITRQVADAAHSGGFEAPPMPKGAPPAADADSNTVDGLTPDQLAAAEKMTPEQRKDMVNAMIVQLAAKLQAEPNDLDGWLRIARAYTVQGENGKAADAYDQAAKLKPSDPSIKMESVSVLLSNLQPNDPIPPRAENLLREVAAVAPDSAEVLWYLGVIAAREGRQAEAEHDWTALLAKLDVSSEDHKLVQDALKQLKTGP
jgi:cytochrome c-type biogenesis protein CcmH